MSPRIVLALLRLYRLSVRQRAAEADAQGRPCCALTLWHVGQDVNAGIKFLSNRPRRKETP